jgi:hypothetical protein
VDVLGGTVWHYSDPLRNPPPGKVVAIDGLAVVSAPTPLPVVEETVQSSACGYDAELDGA